MCTLNLSGSQALPPSHPKDQQLRCNSTCTSIVTDSNTTGYRNIICLQNRRNVVVLLFQLIQRGMCSTTRLEKTNLIFAHLFLHKTYFSTRWKNVLLFFGVFFCFNEEAMLLRYLADRRRYYYCQEF